MVGCYAERKGKRKLIIPNGWMLYGKKMQMTLIIPNGWMLCGKKIQKGVDHSYWLDVMWKENASDVDHS